MTTLLFFASWQARGQCTISGPTWVCTGTTVTYTDAATGGNWYSSATSVVTIDLASGVASGIATGTAIISYDIAGVCSSTLTVSVITPPPLFSGFGTGEICVGSSVTLIDSLIGGKYLSSDDAIATVVTSGAYDGTGILTGVTAGTVTISYYFGVAQCPVTTVITVNPVPLPISGLSAICIGATTTMTDATTGGTWSASGTATVNPTTGVVTPISAGTAVITYSLGTGCNATKIITVETTPVISGSHTICPSSTTALTVDIGGGTWTSGGLVTVSTAGVVSSGTTTGSTTISYTITGCSVATFTMTVEPTPTLTVNPIAQIYCSGSATPDTLHATAGGSGGWTFTWSPAINLSATTGATVMVSGTFTPCTDNIYSVTVTDLYGCQKTVTTNIVVPCDEVCNMPCTTMPLQLLGYSSGASGYISGTIPPGRYYVDNLITINLNTTFSNSIIAVKPSKSITIATNAHVISDNCHFFSCSNTAMWGGFSMNFGSGTPSVTLNNSLIEDCSTQAFNFSTVNPSSVQLFNSVNTIFNRNRLGLYMFNYFDSTMDYPVSMTNTVFMSRNLANYQRPGIANHYPCAWPDPHNELLLHDVWGTEVDLPMKIGDPNGMPTTDGTATAAYDSIACKDGTDPMAGIELWNVGPRVLPTFKGFTINASSDAAGNNGVLFDNLDMGVYARNSNIAINGCYFSHIHKQTGTNNFGMGIFSQIVSGTPQLSVLVNKPTSVSFDTNSNYFYNCNTGVESDDGYNVVANYNKMFANHVSAAYNWNGTYGYNIYNGLSTPFGYNAKVDNNYIESYNTGINYNSFNDSLNGNIEIKNNVIKSGTAAYVGCTTTGIYANNSNHPADTPSGTLTISGNEAYLCYNGIKVTWFQNKQALINHNNINIKDGGGATQYGIVYGNCKNPVINANYVQGYSTAYSGTSYNYMTGIYGGYSVLNASSTCNNVQNFYYGFDFQGTTNPHNTWSHNYMKNDRYGMRLNYSVINNQGDTLTPTDNEWYYPWVTGGFETDVLGAFGGLYGSTSSKLFVRNDTGFYPSPNMSTPGGSPYIYDTSSLKVATGTYSPCYDSFLSWRTSGGGSNRLATNNVANVYEIGVQAIDSITTSWLRADSTPDEIPKRNWVSQMSVYNALLAVPNLIDSSVLLQHFATLAQHSRYKQLTDIANSVNASDFTTAQSLLNSLDAYTNTTNDSVLGFTMADGNDANGVVNSHATFYRMFMKYLQNDTLTDADKLTIKNLAAQCPSIEGTIVFQAQSLFTVLTGDYVPLNNCGTDTSSSRNGRIGSEADPASDPRQNYVLYPNPGNGNITLQQTIMDNSPIEATIYNSMGSKVTSLQLKFNLYFLPVSLNNLPTGLYLLHITNSKNRTFNQKFVIDK